jgi:hypothetical protein
MMEELLDIIKGFVRELPSCHEGCGRPATRQAEGDCYECGHYGNLFCDRCDVPLSAKFKTSWREIPQAALARRASKALGL